MPCASRAPAPSTLKEPATSWTDCDRLFAVTMISSIRSSWAGSAAATSAPPEAANMSCGDGRAQAFGHRCLVFHVHGNHPVHRPLRGHQGSVRSLDGYKAHFGPGGPRTSTGRGRFDGTRTSTSAFRTWTRLIAGREARVPLRCQGPDHRVNARVGFRLHLLVVRVLDRMRDEDPLGVVHAPACWPASLPRPRTPTKRCSPRARPESRTIPCHANCTWYRSLSRRVPR